MIVNPQLWVFEVLWNPEQGMWQCSLPLGDKTVEAFSDDPAHAVQLAEDAAYQVLEGRNYTGAHSDAN